MRGTAELSALWTLLRSLVDALHTALAALRGLQSSIDLACPRCLGEEKKAIGWDHPIREPSLYDLDQLLEGLQPAPGAAAYETTLEKRLE